MAKYENIIESGIGRVLVESFVSNSFPMVGDTVEISSKTKYAQKTTFDLKESLTSEKNVVINNINQEAKTTFDVLGEGDLLQRITAENASFDSFIEQFVYATTPKDEPYFGISVSSEIVRTNEEVDIIISPEMGYLTSNVGSIFIEVYKENETTMPVASFSTLSFITGSDKLHSGNFNINKRGYYDVKVTLTDSQTNTSFTKRINKIITVTPRLAERPTQQQIDNNDYTEIIASSKYGVSLKMYETGVNDLYCVFDLKEGQTGNDSGWYEALPINLIPSGKAAYTFVIKKDMSYKGGDYATRILLKGATNCNSSNENGTPQFSFDNPLVFTIDQNTQLDIKGIYYSTVNYGGCIRNTVWDGRGYYNIQKGLKFSRFKKELFWEDAFMVMNGTSDIEIFECEICETGFTPIMSKTDPSSSIPWFWKDNFIEYNFVWHHSYMHDTGGEGCYLGYFTSEERDVTYTGPTTTFKNLKGEDVTYETGKVYKNRAHEMNKLRLFRNVWERNGYDGVQVSNATESEFCYNKVNFGAVKNEKDQASGVSLQSMDGLIYNNEVYNHSGPAYQLGPYKIGFDFFNNVCLTFKKTDAIQFLWSVTSPDHNPSGGGVGAINDVTVMNLFNNTLIAGRYTANGRNTVQMHKVFFKDNVLVNQGVDFSNMATDTLQIWNEQKKNNRSMTVENFLSSLPTLKFADIYHFDFRIASDSDLIDAGCGDNFTMDRRGYFNWLDGEYPIGAYMGHYRIKNIPITSLTISNKPTSIDGGYQCSVTLTPTNTTQRRVIWQSSDTAIATVSDTGFVSVVSSGSVTITAKSMSNETLVDSFTTNCIFREPPTSINITSVDSAFLGDTVELTASVEPSSAVQKVLWELEGGENLYAITDLSAKFDASIVGTKKVTAVHISYPNISSNKNIVIATPPIASTILISLGRLKEDGITYQSGTTYVGGVNEVGYLAANGTFPLKDVNGNPLGTLLANNKISQGVVDNGFSENIPAQNGFTQLQLKACSFYAGSNGSNTWSIMGITGRFRVKLFCSNNYSTRPATLGAYYQLIASEITHNLTVGNVDNNLNNWLQQDVIIGSSGLQIVIGNNGGTNGFSYIPLNAIILEPISQ